jgi:hypothetical protein
MRIISEYIVKYGNFAHPTICLQSQAIADVVAIVGWGNWKGDRRVARRSYRVLGKTGRAIAKAWSLI